MKIEIKDQLLDLFKSLHPKNIEIDPKTHDVKGFSDSFPDVTQDQIEHVLSGIVALSKKDGWVKYVVDQFSIIPNTNTLKKNIQKTLFKYIKKGINHKIILNDDGIVQFIDYATTVCGPNTQYLFLNRGQELENKIDYKWTGDLAKYSAIYVPDVSELAGFMMNNLLNGVTPAHQMFYFDGMTLNQIKH